MQVDVIIRFTEMGSSSSFEAMSEEFLRCSFALSKNINKLEGNDHQTKQFAAFSKLDDVSISHRYVITSQ